MKECIKYHGGTAFWNHGGREACMVCLHPQALAEVEAEVELAQLRKQVAGKGAGRTRTPSLSSKELAAEGERIRLECLREMAIGAPTGLSKRVQKKLKREATVAELKAAGLTVPHHRLTEEERKAGAGGSGDKTADDAAAAEAGAEPMDEDAYKKDKTPLERYGISEERLTTLGVPWHRFAWKAGDLGKAYALPREATPFVATVTVARALQGEVSEAIAAKQTAVARLLAATEGLRQSLGEKDSIYLQSCARLKTEDEELQRMVKKSQPKKNASAAEIAKATALRLKLTWQEMETENADRAKNLAAGHDKAKERHKADLAAVDELVQELAERKVLLAEQFALAETAWAERREQVSRHDAEVMRLLADKVAAATPAGGDSQLLHGKAADGADEAAEVSDSEGDGASYADLALTAAGTQPEDVPLLLIKDASPEEKTTLEEVWAFFEAVKVMPMGTSTPPTTFKQMGLPHVTVAQGLIGLPIWTKVYGPKRQVGPEDFVPWHLMELIRVALSKAKEELKSGPERRAAAEERFNAAKLAAKNDGYCPW